MLVTMSPSEPYLFYAMGSTIHQYCLLPTLYNYSTILPSLLPL